MEAFETARLRLRPLVEGDLEALCALYSQPAMMRFITGRPRDRTQTLQRLEKNLGDHARYGFGLYATLLKETGELIGRCGIDPVRGEDGIEGALAWMIAEPLWGQGYATEAGAALVALGSERLRLRRLFATAKRENLASIAVMRKLGLKLVRMDLDEVEYEAPRRRR